MTLVSLRNVTVQFPIYSLSSRSLKRKMLEVTTGGRISQGKNNLVVVEALSDLSLDLKEGDRVGILGHNGAGKTTLLRVVGGIYEPSYGEISVYGRTTSILDLNLAMEHEATGYENIILRGLYNGMTLKEIEEATPWIVEFCGLGDYLQMPLRTYSSGMVLRLAFSISMCRQPEVIVMDEGISTLDDEFMEKAKQRLIDMTAKSKVLVMASHQMDLVKALCNKIMFIEHGKLLDFGPIDEVLARHHKP